VLSGLGYVDTTAGDYGSAERHLAEARDIFRRGGDRWGLAASRRRTADVAFARGRLDEAQAALEEARAVLGPTQRERWIAHTLVGMAEVALLRGENDKAAELLTDARERYASRDDSIGVADAEERLRELLRAV
jgi:tetratricopeptide (TPR) repeat protein